MKDDDDELSDFFRDVPVRPEPTADSTRLAHAALNQEWHLAVQRQANTRRRWQSLSVAASVTIAAIVGVLMWPTSVVETIKVQSASRLLLDSNPVSRNQFNIAPEQTLYAANQASLLLGQVQIRLAADTELTWKGQLELSLVKGQLYVDTEGDSSVLVHTRFGSVTDVGTQFLVSLQSNELYASVREGSIVINTESSQHIAKPRELETAVIVLSNNSVRQHFESRSNPRWEWVHNTPTRYHSQRLAELLPIIANDLGKRLEYSSKGVEASVASMRINGTLNPARPRETLDIITRSSNLRFAENEQAIKIDRMR